MKKKTAARILVAILALATFYGVYLGWIKRDMSDFGVCYRNGQRILSGETLYRVSDGHLQYKYAPVSALLYAPLALLPYETAKIVWFYFEVILLFGTFWLSYKILPSPKKNPWFVIGLTFLALGKFIGREFELGQVNTLIIFILIAVFALLLENKEWSAGVLWGISLFFKPYALVFLPYFILRRKIKTIASGGAVLAAGLALPIVNFGFGGNLVVLKEWVSTLSKSTPGLMAVGDNASLYALLWKTVPGHSENVTKILWVAGGCTAAVLFLAMMRQASRGRIEKPELLEASYLFILIPLFSPLGWYYNYLYALPAIALLLNEIAKIPRTWKYVLVADLVLIGGTTRELLGKSLFRFYTHQSLVAVNFAVILIILVYTRAKKIA